MNRMLVWLAWKVDAWLPSLPRLTGVWCSLTAILVVRTIAALIVSSATAAPLVLLSLIGLAGSALLLTHVLRAQRGER